MIWKQLRVEGFLVVRWNNRWMEGFNQLKEWIVQVSIVIVLCRWRCVKDEEFCVNVLVDYSVLMGGTSVSLNIQFYSKNLV